MKFISKVATHPPTRFLHCCEKFRLHSLVTGKDGEVCKDNFSGYDDHPDPYLLCRGIIYPT